MYAFIVVLKFTTSASTSTTTRLNLWRTLHTMAFVNSVTSLGGRVSLWFGRHDDDVFDRLSHRFTAVQLVVFAILVS